MLITIVKLVEEMRKSSPFFGDKAYVRSIIDTLIKDEYSGGKSKRLEELEERINDISLKMNLSLD